MTLPAAHRLLQPVRRWTALRKAGLVEAIESGELRRDQAMLVHGISAEELESWFVKGFGEGVGALLTTKLQSYPAVRT